MKTYKLIFWQQRIDRNGKKLPPKALGEAEAKDVPDNTSVAELCGHWEGFAKMFMREMGITDYVTAEEIKV